MDTLKKLSFLKNISRIRKNQPNDGNRNPVFWLIQSLSDEICPVDNAESISLTVSGNYFESSTYLESDIIHLQNDLINDINEHIDRSSAEEDDINEAVAFISNTDSIEEIAENLSDYSVLDSLGYNMTVTGTRKEYKPVYDHLFLFKDEAKEHIESCHYRYNQPRTYANTALEASKTEKVLNLLEDEELWTYLYNMQMKALNNSGKSELVHCDGKNIMRVFYNTRADALREMQEQYEQLAEKYPDSEKLYIFNTSARLVLPDGTVHLWQVYDCK